MLIGVPTGRRAHHGRAAAGVRQTAEIELLQYHHVPLPVPTSVLVGPPWGQSGASLSTQRSLSSCQLGAGPGSCSYSPVRIPSRITAK